MLSILIPIYNFKVEALVKALMRQCNRIDLDYEILCFDDGSRKKIKYENSILSDYFGVNYTELSENLGRARIRNWMAKSASYENLLFLDCDSRVLKKDVISTYLDLIGDYDIVSGGGHYAKKKPRAKSKYLHWLYGSKRESVAAAKRQSSPAMFFHSNNFMVRREVMMDHAFDEQLEGYGYEDLLWAQRLLEDNYSLKHINNPVEHLGLEKADVFLKKTDRSIQNLVGLIKRGEAIETQLTRFAERLKKWHLDKMVNRYLESNHENLKASLLSSTPKLYQLQLYKLYLYNFYINTD